eukprot:TRINITY_DN39804_c0_g1_i1.p1 TRINITY_DN39804_c0_g1~~TRINITY_DN39804_c0_g1_i1.p1  ORF type:complete len:393 (-),score=94.41 TRINITY_DN39804_c0_g1_i1:34-1212(-)
MPLLSRALPSSRLRPLRSTVLPQLASLRDEQRRRLGPRQVSACRGAPASLLATSASSVSGSAAAGSAIRRSIYTQVPITCLELHRAGELARIEPAKLTADDVRAALKIFKDLPKLMLQEVQISAIAQQLLRVLFSYRGWYLPTAVREGAPGGSSLWSVGLPCPEMGSAGGQVLPLASDEAAFRRLTAQGVREGGGSTILKTCVSGAAAIAEHFPVEGHSRWRGLVLNAGEEHELHFGQAQLSQLQMWEATLRFEAMAAAELDGPANELKPASEEFSRLLAERVKFCFVRMGGDLARDTSGRNIVTLTSNDAAALCANSYGREQIRAVTPQELLTMASGAAGAFEGYALTRGPDLSAYTAAKVDDAPHTPTWRTATVTTNWMAETLRRGGVGN